MDVQSPFFQYSTGNEDEERMTGSSLIFVQRCDKFFPMPYKDGQGHWKLAWPFYINGNGATDAPLQLSRWMSNAMKSENIRERKKGFIIHRHGRCSRLQERRRSNQWKNL